MTNDNDERQFRPERFISNGDDEFANDWEIIESEEDSDESQADRGNSADDEALKTDVHPPYSGAPKVADQLREVAANFGIGKGRK